MNAFTGVCMCAHSAVDRMRGSVSYFICLSQWITLHAATRHSHKHLHADTCAWIRRIPSAMFGESKTKVKESSVAHKQPAGSNKTTDTHFPRLLFPYFCSVSEFAAPAVKYPRSYSATENSFHSVNCVWYSKRFMGWRWLRWQLMFTSNINKGDIKYSCS